MFNWALLCFKAFYLAHSIGFCSVRCSFASLYSVHKKQMKYCSLDTPENLRRQQQWHVAGCSLPICAKLSICAALFGSATIVSGFGSIWPCHSRDANITTNCKVMENQSWEEAVVKRISPVAVVALFHVLWVFFDSTAISRTVARVKCSSIMLSHMTNEKVKQGHKQSFQVSSAEH